MAESTEMQMRLGDSSIRRIETRAEAAEGPFARLLLPGDFVLKRGELEVAVGGLGRTPRSAGAVLAIVRSAAGAREPTPISVQPALSVQHVTHAVRVHRIFPVARAGGPALRIEGVVELVDRAIEVHRELSLSHVPDTLSIALRASALTPTGEQGLRFSARVAWGSARPWLSNGRGLEDERTHEGAWIGSDTQALGAAIGFVGDALRARAAYEAHAAGQLRLETDLEQRTSFRLRPRVHHDEKLILTLSPRGLAGALRSLAFARGRPLPEVWCTLPYQPAGAEVQLLDGDGRVHMSSRPDAQGRVVLPLEPGGTLRAVARAYGHAPSDEQPLVPGGPCTLTIPRGGQIRVHVRDARTREALPARIRILPIRGTARFSLGPDHRGAGAGDTTLAPLGGRAAPVPSGHYRVLVMHGPEWSVWEEEVDVSPTFSPRVDALLARQIEPGDFVACDLHVHSHLSADSQVSLTDRLATLAAEGVELAVPTEHNHVGEYATTADALGMTGLRSVPGVEITSDAPALGHFNAYPFPRDPTRPGNGAPPHDNLVPSALFASLHRLDPDMVVQINHPRFEGGIGYFDVMRLDARTGAADPRYSAAFDAVEVFNGFDLARPERVEQVFLDWLKLLARGQRVAATGSSDSHEVRYQLAGYPRTYAHVRREERDDARAIVRAIKSGRSFVTSGPFVEARIGEGGPGDTVQADDAEVRLRVRVRTPDWMQVDRLEVFVGDERAHARTLTRPVLRRARASRRAPSAPTDREERVTLSIAEDTFVIVRVSGSESLERFFGRAEVKPLAFTNPIFVDADGDGTTPWTFAAPRP